MASPAMELLPVPKNIKVTGIDTHLTECLEHPLLIKLRVDGIVVCMFLKKKERHTGTRAFQKPLDLDEKSMLIVQVQEKHRTPQTDKPLACVTLSLQNIWRGQDSGTPDARTMKYPIPLGPHKNHIWLNFIAFPPKPQPYPNSVNQNVNEYYPPYETQELNELKYYLLDGIKTIDSRADECIPGTRAKILADIITKTGDVDEANIIWIRGAPGSGKSSLSLSAKARLYAQGRLVTYYRFDRNESSTTTPTALWRHVAYELGRRLPSIQLQLLRQLRDDTVDLDSPMAVFASLIEDPLSRLTDPSVDYPFVIVIDGLDECGGLAGHLSPDRQVLLQTLRRWSQLPKHFKLLVTSREEGVFARVLSSISTPIDVISGHFLAENPQHEASIHACNDIRIFLEGRFRLVKERIPSLPRGWPGVTTIDSMVGCAAGVFMWATAAMNFIDGRGIDPEGRLRKIMIHVSESSGMKPLYSLYNTILETAFGDISSDDSEAHVLQSVLGTMVVAKRPLHDIEYSKLPTREPVTQEMLDSVRDGLHSVLAIGDLRFTHKSFDDFLLSKECPPKYAIRMDESQYLLTGLCLTTMAAELCFNICNLETSCLKNVDVPDIEVKVAHNIPTILSYSCCFFADHLTGTSFDHLLLAEVRATIMDKLLYWFEVMSLLKQINRASPSLLSILKWSHPSPDEEFKEFLHDARRFIGAFIYPIAQSAPHIYVSALPLAPEYSIVARHFLARFPRLIALSAGKTADWPSCLFVSEQHEDWVLSIAFSPDDKYFVSGSDDGTICICDSETGNLVSGPFKGDSRIRRVFFDPNGGRVWTLDSDDKVVGWDSETGNRYLQFQAGYAMGGCCRINGDQTIIPVAEEQGTVALWSADTGERLHDLSINDRVGWVQMSPNGHYIACAGFKDSDTIVRIWKLVEEGEIRYVRGPSPVRRLYKHTKPISALSFSIDGMFVVSGSWDGTILIWDVRTGDTVGPPLDTREGVVHAVAYSHESRLLVSACGSNTMTVWNASTLEATLSLEGHTSSVTHITLSRDGRTALTASRDKTVRKWDLGKREAAYAVHVNERHTRAVVCCAFSPSGKRLASLGINKKIYFWDANTGEPLPIRPITLHEYYSQIILSPEGDRIAAYSSSGGYVRVWNVDTGDLTLYQDSKNDNSRSTRSRLHTAFRSADQRFLTCSDGVVRIWTTEGGALTEDLSVTSPQPLDASKPIEVLALSPSGLIAIVRDDSRKPCHYMWNTMAYQPLPPTFVDDKYMIGYPSKYSNSGKYFAVASDDYPSALRVWNTQTGQLTAGPSIFNGEIRCLTFSPDDSHIAFCYSPYSGADSTAIWIWDVRTGLLDSGLWSGHTSDITALEFSPEGDKLVSGADNGQIRIRSAINLLGNSETPAVFVAAGTRIQDGWVKDEGGQLLCWMPIYHREKLVWKGTIAVMGGKGITAHLDFTGFRYGENWTECREGGCRWSI